MNKEIIGKWVFKDGKVVADSNCELIKSIIKNDLSETGISEEGWIKLYQHTNGSIWELTYPESHLHGGGPPKLKRIKNVAQQNLKLIRPFLLRLPKTRLKMTISALMNLATSRTSFSQTVLNKNQFNP